MVRRTLVLLRQGGGSSIAQALSDVLVCPLSKQPLRHCEITQSLVSDAIGVSFPIVDGIPCLVPKDGKLLEEAQEKSEKGESIRQSSLSSET